MTGEIATAAQHNDPLEDIQTDLNTVRPIVAGGTGADTAVEALDALTVKSSNIASAATTNLATASGRLVHITGTTTITAFGTLTAGIERELVFDGALTLTHNATSLILPGGVNITTVAGDVATMVSEGSGNWRCLSYQQKNAVITPFVAYTPIFTGFGTVSAVSIWSKRDGDTLHIRGRFQSGTSTAVEARMSLGFNGVEGSLTVNATKVTNLQLSGLAIVNANAAAHFATLVEPSVGYITFGIQTATSGALASANGSAIISSGSVMSIQAEIPITGW